VFLVHFRRFVLSCQYQCKWLPGKTRPQNDLLCRAGRKTLLTQSVGSERRQRRDSYSGSVVPTKSLTLLSVSTGWVLERIVLRSPCRLVVIGRCMHADAPQYLQLQQFTRTADVPSRQRLRSSTTVLPIVCLFLTYRPKTFYCWTSRLSCRWCMYMGRFTFGHYFLTSRLLPFKQRLKCP